MTPHFGFRLFLVHYAVFCSAKFILGIGINNFFPTDSDTMPIPSEWLSEEGDLAFMPYAAADDAERAAAVTPATIVVSKQ